MKASKKFLALSLCAVLGLSLIAGCDSGKQTIDSGKLNENGYIVVANSPEEVKVNEGDLTSLAQATDLTFNCETLEYSFTGVEGADYYYIRVFPVIDGEESNSASFQSDKIEAGSGTGYTGTIQGQTLLAGDYAIYVVASGSGHTSSEARITGSSSLIANVSLKASFNTGTDENPTVTAEITVTPGDDIAKQFTVTITDESGKVVYTNDKATAETIRLTAADLGAESLTVEDVYQVSVTINPIDGYTVPTEAVTAQITENKGSGFPGGPGGS